MFLVLLGLVGKAWFGLIKDIHFYLLVVVALPWISPMALEGDWRGSTLVPGATNWHISLVCRKPPTRHTCYMHVAKNGISAPLPHIVWTQQSVPLSTCVSIPQFQHAQNVTHTCRSPMFMHTYTHTRKPMQTWAQALLSHLKTNWQMLVCGCTHIHTQEGRQINTHSPTHTHTRICIHNHTHNSGQIVYCSIGSLTKWCMAVVL